MAIVARWKEIRPRTRTIGMNKLESAYGLELEKMKLTGEIIEYKFEAVKLRLADRTYYTPDWFVIFPGHLEFRETKGFMRDDAAVKLKVAAEQFPWFRFVLVKYVKKQWITQEV